MPHLVVEYSKNLDNGVDIAGLCEKLRIAALATGEFPEAGIRVRARKCEVYAIADGQLDAGFIDISVRLRGGRSLEVRKKATAEIFVAAESFLEPIFDTRPLALSMEMRDIDPELSPKRSSIRAFMTPEKSR